MKNIFIILIKLLDMRESINIIFLSISLPVSGLEILAQYKKKNLYGLAFQRFLIFNSITQSASTTRTTIAYLILFLL